MNNILYFRLIRLFIAITLLFLLFILMKYTFIYLYPFIIAMTIAFLLHPIVSHMEMKWKLSRGVATFICIFFFFIIIITFCFILVKQLLKETTTLVEHLPIYFDSIQSLLTEIIQAYVLPIYKKVAAKFTILPPYTEWDMNYSIQLFLEDFGSSSTSFMKNAVLSISSFLSSLTYIGTIIIIILLATYITTKDLHQIKLLYHTCFPKKMTRQFLQIKKYAKRSVLGFVKAQLIIAFFSSILALLGLLIFKVEHVVTITLSIFFVDFIPYIGIGIIFIPWVVYHFFSDHYTLTIQLGVLYMIIIIVRQMIEPKILATNVGVHPLIALIVLFVCFQLFGIIALIITPLILIIISSMYHAGVIEYLISYIKNG